MSLRAGKCRKYAFSDINQRVHERGHFKIMYWFCRQYSRLTNKFGLNLYKSKVLWSLCFISFDTRQYVYRTAEYALSLQKLNHFLIYNEISHQVLMSSTKFDYQEIKCLKLGLFRKENCASRKPTREVFFSAILQILQLRMCPVSCVVLTSITNFFFWMLTIFKQRQWQNFALNFKVLQMNKILWKYVMNHLNCSNTNAR